MRPVRFDYLRRFLPDWPTRILDVGCGNRSPSLTKKYIPDCEYHGIDLHPPSSAELSALDHFYQLDLDSADLALLPDRYFDCILLSHVIEHLNNGERVLITLLEKLRPGGVVYVETPAPRSIRFPSMKGTLNFHDDVTHVRVYALGELRRILEEWHCVIVYAGVRRSWKRIMLFPAHLVYSLLRYRYISGTVFWDILGFANIVVARRDD